MQSYAHLYDPMIQKHGLFSVPEGQAALSSMDTRDIARIAANILRDHEAHYHKVYDLKDPQSRIHAQVAELISSAIGRPIRYMPATLEGTAQVYQKLRLSNWKIEVLISLHRFIEAGGADTRMGDTADLLGVKPRRLSEFAVEHTHRWLLKSRL